MSRQSLKYEDKIKTCLHIMTQKIYLPGIPLKKLLEDVLAKWKKKNLCREGATDQ